MLDTADKAECLKAQEPEIKGLEEMKVLAYLKKNMLPKNSKLLTAVQSYQRKCRPDRALQKYKARLCANGSQQETGVDYKESFAPVVSWSTVRMSLILVTILNLEMRKIDCVQAYPQAECTEDTYMQMPAGCKFKDKDGNGEYVIKLEKNLYGTVTRARNWFNHFKKGLILRGFKQATYNPCLFMR